MAKRKSAKPSTQSPKPVERQGKLYLPQEIMEYAGVAPDMLRDWRRRGLIDGFGMILLPDGSTTSNLEHPALLEVLRPQWVYTISDLTALAIARHLNAELRLDLKDALQLATSMNAKVLAWLPGHYGNLTRDYREPRFVLAWPLNAAIICRVRRKACSRPSRSPT